MKGPAKHTLSSLQLILATLLLGTALSTVAQPQKQHIKFACSESSESPLFKMLELVFSHFFTAEGYQFSMQTTSEQRMILEVSSGRLDGACGQNKPVFEDLNDSRLMQTNTPIANLAIRALSRKHLSGIQVLEELRDSPHRVGIIASTGTALAAQQQQIHFQNIVTVDRGVKMLAANRLDYVVSNHLQINRALNDVGSMAPLHISKALFYLPLHPVLNKKHSDLIVALDTYLSQLNLCQEGPLTLATSDRWLQLTPQAIDICLNDLH